MLYDPKWEVKADPLSLESLIAWLETKDPASTYDFCDLRGNCLVDQWCRPLGRSYSELPDKIRRIAYATPWTFGAALKRARAALMAKY
jgi:hypothetical protein